MTPDEALGIAARAIGGARSADEDAAAFVARLGADRG